MGDQEVERGSAEALIARANKIISEAEDDFEGRLKEDIDELKLQISSGGSRGVVAGAYRLKGRAGSLGWPLVSSAANGLAKLLERNPRPGSGAKEVEVFIEALELMHSEGMKGEDPRGQLLVRELYKLVDEAGTPGS